MAPNYANRVANVEEFNMASWFCSSSDADSALVKPFAEGRDCVSSEVAVVGLVTSSCRSAARFTIWLASYKFELVLFVVLLTVLLARLLTLPLFMIMLLMLWLMLLLLILWLLTLQASLPVTSK